MNSWTSPVDIRPDHLEIVQEILRVHLPAGFKVWVFGSRANWTTKDSSDLDLAVEGAVRLDHKSMIGLEVAFEESDLPYTVDVVDLKAVSSGFRQIVEDQRLSLPLHDQAGKAEWETTSWGDIATLEYGKSLRGYESSEGPYRVYGTNGPIGWCNEPLCFHPSVIIGRKGAYRGVHYSATPFFVIDTAFYLKPKVEIDTRWAYYELLTHDINGMDSGSAIPSTSREDFYGLPVKVPPLSEQRAIAHVLGTLDDKIELNRRMNRTLEEMARAIFQDWFVDFGPTRAKMEGLDPYLPPELWDLFPDELVDSELGEIPEGWQVEDLGQVVEVFGGATPSTKMPEYWEGGTHCWATPKDLSNITSPVLLDTERKITDAGLNKISSGLLPSGTLLLSSRAPIGYLAISEVPVAINQGFIAMPPRDAPSNWYMMLWCKASHEEIISHANGSTFLEISKANFRKIPMVLPDSELLSEFDKFVGSLYGRVSVNQRESQTMATKRDGLLPILLSGTLTPEEQGY